jgi:hypothetical protein
VAQSNKIPSPVDGKQALQAPLVEIPPCREILEAILRNFFAAFLIPFWSRGSPGVKTLHVQPDAAAQ